jgi:hypothetical protein
MTHQDAATALALYFVYPAILYLLIDKFHGLCGHEKYIEKAEAIAVNEAFYIPFTALMRTHKIMSIILFQAQASDKDEDDENKSPKSRSSPSYLSSSSSKRKRNYNSKSDDDSGGGGGRGSGSDSDSYVDDDDDDDDDDDYDDDDDDDGCTREKCRVWFHLSQEWTAVCCVAFLLLICLPVLAFWFMFLGIIASAICNIMLLRRIWKDAHLTYSSSSQQPRSSADEEEFQEFLRNFT